MLETIITSKTRLKLLLRFFVSATSSAHLRGIAGELEDSTNSIRKELNKLSNAGYLVKQREDNKIVYKANTSHSLFRPIQSLLHSFLGIENYIDKLLENAGDISLVALVGDYARGLEGERIEVLVIGEDLNILYITSLAQKVQERIEKKIEVHFKDFKTFKPRLILFEKDSI